MIRIAVVMGKMHSGGKKNLVMEYYRQMNKSKIQFDFICDSDSNAIPKDEIIRLGGKIYIVEPYQNIFKNYFEIRNILKTNNYKIVHAYNNTLNVFSMLAAKQAHVPIRINESISMANDEGDWKNGFKKILRPINRFFSTNYLANGETCGRWQFGDKLFNNQKVQIFKSVIDVSKHTYDKNLREKTRSEFGISNEIVIGHIGRLTEQKNSLFLIDIFREVVQMNSKAKLILVGDGNLKAKVLEKIENYDLKNNVIYLGRTEDIYRLYNAMDCFLLPSLYEGLPIVGIEAECTGLPVFFSTAVPRESSPCDDLGFFIDLNKSPNFWAKEIIRKTKSLSSNRVSREKELIKKGFDSRSEAKRLENYYEKLDECYE